MVEPPAMRASLDGQEDRLARRESVGHSFLAGSSDFAGASGVGEAAGVSAPFLASDSGVFGASLFSAGFSSLFSAPFFRRRGLGRVARAAGGRREFVLTQRSAGIVWIQERTARHRQMRGSSRSTGFGFCSCHQA